MDLNGLSFRVTGVLAIWFLYGGLGYRNGHLPSGLLFDAGEVLGDGTIVLQPAGWLGKPFPLLGYIENADPLVAGEWEVVLYHRRLPAVSGGRSPNRSQAGSNSSGRGKELRWWEVAALWGRSKRPRRLPGRDRSFAGAIVEQPCLVRRDADDIRAAAGHHRLRGRFQGRGIAGLRTAQRLALAAIPERSVTTALRPAL